MSASSRMLCLYLVPFLFLLGCLSTSVEAKPTQEADVICSRLVVSNAGYAKCNGEYRIVDMKVEWAPSRPVYKLVNKNRYIFWNKKVDGWSIGNKQGLTTGVIYHHSGLDTKEPWQGVWKGEDQAKGVQFKCMHGLLLNEEFEVRLESLCSSSSYTVLNEDWRKIDYYNRVDNEHYIRPLYSDANLTKGWYRLQGAAGTRLPTSPAPNGIPGLSSMYCGAINPAYITGGEHPTPEEGIVSRGLCFEYLSGKCYWPHSLKVAACNGDDDDVYYIYELSPRARMYELGYCGLEDSDGILPQDQEDWDAFQGADKDDDGKLDFNEIKGGTCVRRLNPSLSMWVVQVQGHHLAASMGRSTSPTIFMYDLRELASTQLTTDQLWSRQLECPQNAQPHFYKNNSRLFINQKDGFKILDFWNVVDEKPGPFKKYFISGIKRAFKALSRLSSES